MTVLSHYTRHAGLEGIAQTKALKATDFLRLNDKTELMYGLEAILKKAAIIAINKIPTDLRNSTRADNFAQQQVPQHINSIRETIRQGDGFDTAYVVSFAEGRNDDENERGILTLWDRYTQTKGYCLQFDRDKIQRLVRSEITFHTYGLIQLIDVEYGINTTDRIFLELVDQFALMILTQMARNAGDQRFLEGMPKRQPESYVTGKLLLYCGSHKDPCFADEREVRIFAFPVNSTLYHGRRVTLPKTIYGGEKYGSRYIILGEDKHPGLIPDRVIIGPNSELDETAITAMFPNTIQENRPSILKSTIPILPPN